MKTFRYISAVVALSLGFSAIASAKITLETHGRLGAYYHTPNLNSNLLGLNSTVSADFGLNKNWFIGMGAIGGWSILNATPYSGDVSSAYVSYRSTSNKMLISAGRYNVDRGPTKIRTTDFIRGNIQGISFQFSGINTNLNALNYWFSYINSYLNDGYLPSRIGSEMSAIQSYASSKSKVGGEIFLAGLDYKHKGIFISPWVLLNSRSPQTSLSNYFHPLFQVGAKASFNIGLGKTSSEREGWRSITKGNVIFQYADNSSAANNLAGFVHLDEEIRYTRYRVVNDKKYTEFSASVGAGFLASMTGARSRIFALKDSLRFYGLYVNGADYFRGGNVAGYVFGKFSNSFFEANLLGAFGTYTEFSLAGSYKLYRQSRNSDEGNVIDVDLGLGYTYASASNSGGGNGLFAFLKMHF